jgi:hypothetical protein
MGAEIAGQMLHALDLAGLDLRWNLALLYAAALLWAMPYGLAGVALASVLLHWSLTPIYLAWLHRRPGPAFTLLLPQGAVP